jgi:ribosomal protein S18 acetylase RimI-like enzyme
MFLLLEKSADGQLELAGYGWAGAETSAEVPGGQTTFAVRIGQKHQGKGLATPFCQLIVDGAASLYDSRDFWLETWGSNGGAVHVYHKLGFETVAEKAAERPTVDGSKVNDVRVTMKLANELLPNEA